MRSIKIFLVILLMATILASTTVANAWVISFLWPNANNVYYTTTSTLSSEGVTSFGNANITWNNVSGADKNIYRSGSNSATSFNRNYQNEVFKENTGDDAKIMVTRQYVVNGYLDEFDMRINTYYPWSNSGAAGYYDVQNSATHELGHALWAADVWNQTQVAPQYTLWWQDVTMYIFSDKGETKKRTLHQDDIDGFSASY